MNQTSRKQYKNIASTQLTCYAKSYRKFVSVFSLWCNCNLTNEQYPHPHPKKNLKKPRYSESRDTEELTTFPSATTLRKVEGLLEDELELRSSTSSSARSAAAWRIESANWDNSSIASICRKDKGSKPNNMHV